MFTQSEGWLPASESTYSVACAIDEALKCKQTKEEKCILVGYSGHGFFDLMSYERYFSGQLEDYEYPKEKIAEALKDMPVVPGA